MTQAGASDRSGPAPVVDPTVVDSVEAFGAERFSNRELSRLDFGSRLLDLAEDPGLALLERVKFVAIFSELLDEFFQVRVAGLEVQVMAGVRTRSTDGLRPSQQLEAIRERVLELAHRQGRIVLDVLLPSLEEAGVHFSEFDDVDEDDRIYLDEVFERRVVDRHGRRRWLLDRIVPKKKQERDRKSTRLNSSH